jgi:deoxyribose-phosphate aldolase
VAQVPATVEALTGFDLLEAIGNLTGLKAAGGAQTVDAAPDNGKPAAEEN